MTVKGRIPLPFHARQGLHREIRGPLRGDFLHPSTSLGRSVQYRTSSRRVCSRPFLTPAYPCPLFITTPLQAVPAGEALFFQDSTISRRKCVTSCGS